MEEGDSWMDEGDSWMDEGDSWMDEGDHEDGEGGNDLSPESQKKVTNFMINDDGIRAELIGNMVKDSPEMSWMSTISADAQKKALTIFMEFGQSENANPMDMMAQLQAIPEVAPHFPAMPAQ